VIVPLAITVKFVLVALGVIPDAETVRSMSRTGNRHELLLGPTFYGTVVTVRNLVDFAQILYSLDLEY